MPSSNTSAIEPEFGGRRVASISDLKKCLLWFGGYALTACIPARRDLGAYEKLMHREDVRQFFHRLFGIKVVEERIQRLIGDQLSNSAIDAAAADYFEMRLEEVWARWRASHGSADLLHTEVDGLSHWEEALERGNGVVFWGMSFGRAFFPKVALCRAGVPLTQLSAAEHGTDFPLTSLGKHVSGPIYCRPENFFLCERIRIPEDTSTQYKQRMIDTLKQNGTLWIAAETTRTRRPLTATVFGREALLPAGAPAFSAKQNATLIPVHTLRDGPFRYRTVLQPPIPVNHEMPLGEWLRTAASEYANRLEQLLMQHPGTWSWEALWTDRLTSDQ